MHFHSAQNKYNFQFKKMMKKLEQREDRERNFHFDIWMNQKP